jgi:hypothetical protein
VTESVRAEPPSRWRTITAAARRYSSTVATGVRRRMRTWEPSGALRLPFPDVPSWRDVRVRDLARAEWAPMVGILVMAAVVRVWAVNGLGFNTDEAVYAGQAAAIAGDPDLKDIFPIFRAHPLLFQFFLAVLFLFGTYDLLGRLAAIAIGLATVFLVFKLGELLYGRRTGLVAALLVALMPYHVIVTRQVLLDGPMALFATLALYLLARFAQTQAPVWLYAAGAGMGLTFLSKETGIILLSGIYGFLALSPEIRVRIRDLAIAMASMFVVIAPFPLSLVLAGGGGSQTTGQYLVWQLFRRPNHDFFFYPTVVPPALGLVVIAVALLGLAFVWRQQTWREKLLLSWILVPTLFFQIWPVKGYQYLIAVAPPLAILAASALTRFNPRAVQGFGWELDTRWVRPLATGIVALSLAIPTLGAIQPSSSDQFLAGTGGVPGGREAGRWIEANTPEGSRLLTIGPSMANILQFYGHRRAYGLAVSPNPLHRNPSYEPLDNPDLLIRNNELQYVVWDSFSAARSPFFSEGVMRYVSRYHGRAVHTETVHVSTPSGDVAKPVIIVYEVRP